MVNCFSFGISDQKLQKFKIVFPEMGKIFQAKLREFLKLSTMYHPERLLHALNGKVASKFVHEKALLLSRLGKHEEVMRIYCDELKDIQAAEEYCDRIWRQAQKQRSLVVLNKDNSYNSNDDDSNNNMVGLLNESCFYILYYLFLDIIYYIESISK